MNDARYNFSIVIPTSGRTDLLNQCLAAISHIEYAHGRYEIIIVNNAPGINMKSIKANYSQCTRMRCIEEKRLGPTFARNAGYASSHYQYVLFVDDDVLVDRDVLTVCRDVFLSQPDAALIGGNISSMMYGHKVGHKTTRLQSCARWILGECSLGQIRRRVHHPDSIFSALMAANKQQIDSVLFDTDLGCMRFGMMLFGEDIELCSRLILQCKKVIYEPAMCAVNLIHVSRFSYLYKLKRYLKSGIERSIIDTKLSHFPKYQTPKYSSLNVFRHMLSLFLKGQLNLSIIDRHFDEFIYISAYRLAKLLPKYIVTDAGAI